MRPVSNLICLPPASSTVTSCFMLPLFSRFHSIKLRSRHPPSGREKVQFTRAATWPPENCTGIDRLGSCTRQSDKPRRQRQPLPLSATPSTRSCLTLHERCSRLRTGRVYFRSLDGFSGDAAVIRGVRVG